MSIRKDLFNRIASMEANSEGWIVVNTAELADSVKRDPSLISKMINSLKSTGHIDTRKSDDGRVEAVRVIKSLRGYSSRNGRTRAARGGPRAERVVNPAIKVATPNTDQYAQAKRAYEQAAPVLGEFASVEWHENPLAEEALALKQRNELLLQKVAEATARSESMTRELEYLRKAQNAELRTGLRNAGVLVEHGA